MVIDDSCVVCRIIRNKEEGEKDVETSATGTKQCEAITNVAIRIMRVKGMDEQ